MIFSKFIIRSRNILFRYKGQNCTYTPATPTPPLKTLPVVFSIPFTLISHADIHSVSPQVGSPSGGALVTITGTGFSGSSDSLVVDIDGVPCEVPV